MKQKTFNNNTQAGNNQNMKMPRGIRNNNPLNIRIGNNWKGERVPNTDGVFEQFETMEYGIRAAFMLLRRYINHYHRNTIRKIVESWAPPTENHTNTYVNVVGIRSGIHPDRCLVFTDKPTMCRLLEAMIVVENGQSLPMEIIERGYEMTVES